MQNKIIHNRVARRLQFTTDNTFESYVITLIIINHYYFLHVRNRCYLKAYFTVVSLVFYCKNNRNYCRDVHRIILINIGYKL